MVDTYYNTDLGNLYQGRCQDILKQMPDDSIDSLITDPPAGIGFMNKSWDKDKGGRDKWIEWLTEIMKEAYRVMKPGAYGFVWAIPRTSHWTAMALENAGFEIKDIMHHLFGSGFPKSLNISKKIDKMAGVERDIIGTKKRGSAQDAKERGAGYLSDPANKNNLKQFGYGIEEITDPATPEAKIWDGYGTALKPAAEHWIMIAKPNEGTYAENAIKHGVAGLNIDGGRIKTEEKLGRNNKKGPFDTKKGWNNNSLVGLNLSSHEQGRYPANVILDEDAGRLLDKQSGSLKSGNNCERTKEGFFGEHGKLGKAGDIQTTYGDQGGASRFFYCAKPSTAERNAGCHGLPKKQTIGGGGTNNTEDDVCGKYESIKALGHNFHPTVKSLSLMKYLCTLTQTPTKGIVLDPFAGSGSTLVACEQLGRSWIGIEKEEEYCQIAKARITGETSQLKLFK